MSESDAEPVVEIFFDDLDRWNLCQNGLIARGVEVPLEHRASWLQEVAGTSHWFLVAREKDGDPRSIAAAVPAELRNIRTLPGHHRLRITRFGYSTGSGSLAAILRSLEELVQRHSTILSANVEVFALPAKRRKKIGEFASRLGFDSRRPRRQYRYTARLDLARDEGELLASFSGSCRRFIRDPEKKGFRVTTLRDDHWASRMDELWNETFTRTGAAAPSRAWRDHLAYARNHPDLYHIVGTFGPDYPDEHSLVAFSCAMNNGDHAVYSDGASTRNLDTTVALIYAPMWALIRWARTRECDWFDMGGITGGTYEDDQDPRGGISDFKRRFTDDVVEVGAEWAYAPPSFRASLVDRVSRAASSLRRLLRRHGMA